MIGEKKTVEALAKEKKTPSWLFAAAKVKHRWAQGTLLTPEEFDRALLATRKHKIGPARKGERR